METNSGTSFDEGPSEFKQFLGALRRLGINHQLNWGPTKESWQDIILRSGFALTALACMVIEVGDQEFLFSNGQPHWDERENGYGPAGVFLLSRNKTTGEVTRRRYFNPRDGVRGEGTGLRAMQRLYQFHVPETQSA